MILRTYFETITSQAWFKVEARQTVHCELSLRAEGHPGENTALQCVPHNLIGEVATA